MKLPEAMHLLMYDITNERVLQKTARLLQQNGYERINYSVWIGWGKFGDSLLFAEALKALLKKPEAKGSRVYYLPLTPAGFKKLRSISGRKPHNLNYWAGEQHLRFF